METIRLVGKIDRTTGLMGLSIDGDLEALSERSVLVVSKEPVTEVYHGKVKDFPQGVTVPMRYRGVRLSLESEELNPVKTG